MAIFADRQNQIWRLTAILELPPSWNDGAVARNPGVSWAFLSSLRLDLVSDEVIPSIPLVTIRVLSDIIETVDRDDSAAT